MAKQEYDNTNKGASWANGRHLENENAPAFRIKQNVEGIDYEVALFVATDDADILAAIAEIIEIAEELREDGIRGPLFRTTIKPADEQGGGGKKPARASRRERSGSRPARAPRAESEDSGESW